MSDAQTNTRTSKRTIIKYSVDIALIAVPLAVILYFLFDPDAFNAFLRWLVKVL